MIKNKDFKETNNKVLGFIKSEKYRNGCKFLFLEYLNQPELFEKIDPKRYKEYVKERKRLSKIKGPKKFKDRKKSGNSNKVFKTFKILKPYFEKPDIQLKSHYNFSKKRQRLGVDFYFDYAKIILKDFSLPKLKTIENNIKFQEKEMKILESDRENLRKIRKEKDKEFGIYKAKTLGPLFDLEENKRKVILEIYDKLTELDKKIENIEKQINENKNLIVEAKDFKEFSELEKEIMRFVFETNECRELVAEYDDLIEGITRFFERIFIYVNEWIPNTNLGKNFVKAFLLRNNKYLEIYDNKEEQYEKFWHTVCNIRDNLRNKMKIITNLRDDGIMSLEFNFPFKEMKNIIEVERHHTPKQKENIIKQFSKEFGDESLPMYGSQNSSF